MKKITLIAVFLVSVTAATQLHAFGAGLQINYSAGGIFAPGAAIVVSPSDSTSIAANWFFGSDKNIIGLTMDINVLALPIVSFGAGTFNFTLGAGVFSNFTFIKKEVEIGLGIRVPAGFNLLLMRDFLEIYIHVAPSFGLSFIPNLEVSRPFFPMALGVKVWIR